MTKTKPTFRDPAVQRPFASGRNFFRFNLWMIQWLLVFGVLILGFSLIFEYLSDGTVTLNSVYFTIKALAVVYVLTLLSSLRDHHEKTTQAEKRARRNAAVQQQLQSDHEPKDSTSTRTEPDDPVRPVHGRHNRSDS